MPTITDVNHDTEKITDVNHDTEKIRKTESLIHNMFEKLKLDVVKKEIISELQEHIEKYF